MSSPFPIASYETWVERDRGGVATTDDFIALLRAGAPAGYDVDGVLGSARLPP